MTGAKRYQTSLPDEREFTLTRTFDAPRRLVFDACTRSEMVKRWLFGPAELPMVVCEIDLKVGGRLRYVWRHKERGDMGMSGVFREMTIPERPVHTELFDEDRTGGETLLATNFVENSGHTTVASRVRCSSQAARAAALETGMVEGWSQGHERLDEFPATLVS